MFLAQRKVALLADSPRVGKTGAALIAADFVFAASICIITTASGRPVWKRAVEQWAAFNRTDVLILGWPDLTTAKRAQALRPWDLLILDEAHAAKNFDAKRTQAVFGTLDGHWLQNAAAIYPHADQVWLLTGTPMPNSPADLYPMLRALAPDRLSDTHGPTDVTDRAAYMARYCITKPKKVGNFRWIDVVIGGRNLDELRRRLDGFMLRRTQEDVGIRPPRYELLPLRAPKNLPGLTHPLTQRVIEAAEAGSTRDLEMHMGPLRRITGELKVAPVVEAVRDEFDGGLDKIVLMAWHTDVIDALCAHLAPFGVVRLDGSTTKADRATAEERFRDPINRVFVGQIQAAGEAIDLSAAAELWFVESSFVPKDMSQASLRITNHEQTRQAIVRVCVLEGSIDEALQAVLLRKWSVIREVLPHAEN